MSVRNKLWDPFAVDGIDVTTVPDEGILFPDHGAFQFDAAAPAAASSDWSDIVIDIDFVDDTLTFSETAQLELSISDTLAAQQDETRTLSTPLDELSALYPGIVWPPMSEWASATNDNDLPPDTSSLDDASIVTVQAPSPAGLDWWETPDFDDDPGWYPGWIPSSDQTAPRTDDGAASTSAAVTSSADEAPRDETVTASLTLAELNEQYPGAVWPANWWLL
ncbi:MAG: hypothetical protein AB7S93_19700 [Xanthobacteraceae bacterium]